MTEAQVENLFLYFAEWLEVLGFSQLNAAQAFLLDYWGAWCPYSDESIPIVFQRVALENAKKYDKQCEIYSAEYEPLVNYDRTETESETRTPNLTTSRSETSSGTDNRTTMKNQTEHRAEKAIPPEGGVWKETTTRSVTPYDSGTFAASEKEERTQDGYRETETRYTGDGDTDNTTRSGTQSGTTTETGSETRARTLAVSGNIGTMSAQNMAEQELALAEKMNIFRIIEKDIAAKLFLQVW